MTCRHSTAYNLLSAYILYRLECSALQSYREMHPQKWLVLVRVSYAKMHERILIRYGIEFNVPLVTL